jgi:ABC-type phosphate/phosphonate transport system substrate-binding protein
MLMMGGQIDRLRRHVHFQRSIHFPDLVRIGKAKGAFMRNKLWIGIFLFLLTATNDFCWAGGTYKIGVLAKNGPVKALEMWNATADYLKGKIPAESFEVVPLSFTEVFPAIEAGKVDFFLVNSSMFITAKVKYGAHALATMLNERQGQKLNSFGGVIITSADNADISKFADLKGKTFMAVEKSSFGGWQMAHKELLDAGIDPHKDFAKLEFGGTHDNVVLAVMNGAVKAGTVRTDTLERMAAAGGCDSDPE